MDNYIYLTRICRKEEAYNFEKLIMGQLEEDTQIGKTQDNLVSEVVSPLDLSQAKTAKEALEWNENAKKTAECSTYFFYSENLDDLKSEIIDLCNQPVSEEAYYRLYELGQKRKEDLCGNSYVSMIVFKMPYDILVEYAKEGKAELREGKYGADTEREILSETTIGDDALREMFAGKNGAQVIAYGELHSVLNNRTLFESGSVFDQEGIFDRKYKPSITVDPTNDQKNENQGIDKELSEAEKFLETLKKSGASQEDIELYMSALKSTKDHYRER